MTDATAVRPTQTTAVAPAVTYEVAMPQPASHLFEVTLHVRGWQAARLDLKFPVWTPGSYLVREYARHVQDFCVRAEGTSGDRPLSWRKLGKQHWQVETNGSSDFAVRYRVYANELTVRTNHLDETHGYFNGAALFAFVPGREREPTQVTVRAPAGWRIATPLALVSGTDCTYAAPDFDTLVDSPFEIGTHQVYEFEAAGKPHAYAVWGSGNFEPQRAIADTQKIIATEAEIFGGLPYERYLFLLHLSGSGFGGLEHKTSCSLNYPRHGFRSKDKYNRFMQLVAHEFFHLWNVKRIRPKALEAFDYERENYTTQLWFSEGTTSYYDATIPLRAGVYDARACLDNISKDISRYLNTPGREVQPLSESSFDAWIKLYRRDAYSDNNQISYYLKGELVSLLLDLLARANSDNARSLDDVLRSLWQQFGRTETGFTPADLQRILETVTGADLSDFLARYVDGLDPLPFDEYLDPFGLQLAAIPEDDPVPATGLKLADDRGKTTVKFVEAASAAGLAGISAGDELVALDGVRVSAERFSERLRDYGVGEYVTLTYFHEDELRAKEIELAPPQPASYRLSPVDAPTPAQRALCRGWLGVEPSDLA